MQKPSKMYSRFSYPPHSTAEGRYYGTFRDQTILGMNCKITAKRLPDLDPRAKDELGEATFRRDGFAVHISGCDRYGNVGGVGRIKAIALYQIALNSPLPDGASFGGTGYPGPDAVTIVSPLGEAWEHHGNFTNCSDFVTAEGIYRRLDGWSDFTPMDICQLIQAEHPKSFTDYTEKRHLSAVRRLLETCVGASLPGVLSDDGKIGVARLQRHGRWGYKWIRRETQ